MEDRSRKPVWVLFRRSLASGSISSTLASLIILRGLQHATAAHADWVAGASGQGIMRAGKWGGGGGALLGSRNFLATQQRYREAHAHGMHHNALPSIECSWLPPGKQLYRFFMTPLLSSSLPRRYDRIESPYRPYLPHILYRLIQISDFTGNPGWIGILMTNYFTFAAVFRS